MLNCTKKKETLIMLTFLFFNATIKEIDVLGSDLQPARYHINYCNKFTVFRQYQLFFLALLILLIPTKIPLSVTGLGRLYSCLGS